MDKTLCVLWGKHPLYADGNWIKLAKTTSRKHAAERTRQGFIVQFCEIGKYPKES